MRVFVYFNLHRKCWSIKALNGPNRGRVVAHARDVHLFDVTCKVSEAGRQRVLREQRKNVHAGLVGELMGYVDAYRPHGESFEAPTNGVAITYNPHKYSTFVRRDTEAPVHRAGEAMLCGRSVSVVGELR